MYKGMMTAFAMTDGNQPGDPRKGAERMVDVVRGEGMAEGKTDFPLRLPLGSDALELIRGSVMRY